MILVPSSSISLIPSLRVWYAVRVVLGRLIFRRSNSVSVSGESERVSELRRSRWVLKLDQKLSPSMFW